MPRPSYREQIWQASCIDCDGRATIYPYCNICHQVVRPGDAWDISHIGAPAALDGVVVGVAHRACNREHGATVVTPMVAKAKRQKRNHIGVTAPGLGAKAMPAGKRSRVSKTFNHGVVPRVSQAERHRDFVGRHYFGSRGT